MHALIGNRFLRQFFGSRLQRGGVNPPCKAATSTADNEEVLAQPGHLPGGGPLQTEASQKVEDAGELANAFDPPSGSDQLASHIESLASAEQKQ